MQPIVSIILPTYNGSRFIERAIKSVISQTYEAWELLIVDDGSTDDTMRISEKFTHDARIRVLKNDCNLGIQRSLNKGLREAHGIYIARIDDDDVWIDFEKISKQVSYMEANPDCVLVGTGARVVDENDTLLYTYSVPRTDKNIRSRMLVKNCFVHPSVLFRKESALRVGGYAETSETLHVEDYDLWLRMGNEGALANLSLVGVALTARPNSLSARNRMEQFKKSIALVKKYKNKYPGYFGAWIQIHARYFLFQFFGFIPKSLQKAFMRYYKRWW